MKPKNQNIIRKLLYPIGWLYGIAVAMRNHLFDRNILKSKSYKTAIITVGNITVGGTGKTPMTEYLIKLLKDRYKVVTLSRGYGRRTKGYVEADRSSNAKIVGDEPYQIYRKFKDVRVVVDEDRCHAIERVERDYPETDLIVLDDAYQHRYVNPGRSILLIDYNRPLNEDKLLPYGDLRESANARYRADIVVVTKCPDNMTAFNAREMKNMLDLHVYQELFFTRFRYTAPRSITGRRPLNSLEGMTTLLVSAIANPNPLIEYLLGCCDKLVKILFEDHHSYDMNDVNQITRSFDNLEAKRKCIVITSKDESKLISLDIPDYILNRIYVIDVEVDFLFEGKEIFDKKIIEYVEKNKRNSILFTE